MVAVAACLIAISLGVAASWLVAGLRNVGVADPTFAPDVGARWISIMGGLAGFAVTCVVLLVGQTSNLAKSGSDFTNVLVLFVVAYMGLLASSVQLANVSDKVRIPFDLAAAQHAIATISQYYIYVGWLALRPLFQAFGLTQIADITGWLVVITIFAGFPLLATALVRTGFASGRVAYGLAIPGVLAAVGYVAGVQTLVPGGRVADGTVILAILALVPGTLMHAVSAALPMAMNHPRLVAVLNDRFHLVVLAYAVSVIVILQLLLMSVLGLA